MAMASTFLSEDHFLCSICLDVLTEPVSVPCGHNFCQACINRHWEGKEHCQCPLCNQKFSKGLKLCVNTGFREVVDNFKEHHLIAGNNSPAKPGQVPCDCCLGNKLKASKTCLVCLTSYCETHLEPHLRVPALKRHKLTDPVHNLDDQICKKHNRMLELFCRNDQTCVCLLCTEHSTHDTVPLEKAYADKKAPTWRKKAEVKEIKHRRGKKAQKTKMSEQPNRKGKAKAIASTVVTNQIRAPLRWWIPHASRCGYVPDITKGRYYLEVQPEESTSWDSGVARESMSGMKTFIPDPSIDNWVIRLGGQTNCKSSPNPPIHFFQISPPERVIVFVNYDDGWVTFCDAVSAMPVYTFIGCNFSEAIYMFYRPRPSETHSLTQRLQETTHRIKAWSQLPDTIFVFRCIFFVFALVICICAILTECFLHFEMP